MQVYYTELELPIGRSLAAMTERGLAHLELRPASEKDWLESLEVLYGVRPSRDDRRFALLRRELDAYFKGKLRAFTVPLDAHGTAFQERVWAALLKIPYGRLVTYGGLARTIRKSGAARAIGGAVGSNPVPILIPCHRVVASGGGLGGYSSGVDLKELLLKLEGMIPPYVTQ